MRWFRDLARMPLDTSQLRSFRHVLHDPEANLGHISRLAWEYLGIPWKPGGDGWGEREREREVWAVLFRLLPRDLDLISGG